VFSRGSRRRKAVCSLHEQGFDTCISSIAMSNAQRFVVFTILMVRGCVKYAVAHKGERKYQTSNGLRTRKRRNTDWLFQPGSRKLTLNQHPSGLSTEWYYFQMIDIEILLSLHRKYRIAFGVLDVDQGVAYGVYQDTIQTNGYNISCLIKWWYLWIYNTRWRGFARLILKLCVQVKKKLYSLSISHF